MAAGARCLIRGRAASRTPQGRLCRSHASITSDRRDFAPWGHGSFGKPSIASAIFLLLAASTLPASGDIFPYDDMELEGMSSWSEALVSVRTDENGEEGTHDFDHLIYRESGMFAPANEFREAADHAGDGESFIRLTELKFESNGLGMCSTDEVDLGLCDAETGHVDLAIFEQKSFNNVGVVAKDRRYYCCDEEAVADGACTIGQAGELLLKDTKDVWWHKRLDLPPGQQAGLDHTELYRIAETGMYVVLMGNCDERTGTIRISGHSEWKNPYGYLPGEQYGKLPFFFALAVVYLGLGVLWMTVCMIYIKDLLAIQMWASLVLLLGMVEMCAQYFDYRDWNLEGARSPGAQSFAILAGAGKRALSFSLVLMVCMGYGVVRPSLGRDVHKIMALALFYFLSSALSVAVGNGGNSRDKDFSNRAELKISNALGFINMSVMFFFSAWTMQSMLGVIQHLRARRQTAKLQLYVQFRWVLAGSVIFSVAWTTYGIVRSTEEETERRWQTTWIVNAMWEILYLAILLAVCFLLRPSMNAQRFLSGALGGGKRVDGDAGDILLQSINEEDAEYGGALDDGEDKDDDFIAPGTQKPKALIKKENQD